MTRVLAALAVCAAATLPYLSTIHHYFVQDDFGVVQLLASKPAGYFPRWFTTTWMDGIWGFVPDEIRPFPAVSYQIAAWWGAGSPVANHIINIAFHAANGLLVIAVARVAVGISLPAATFAAIAFVLLPIQAESVAWITGRVDSMPAFFYVASFVLYVSWRRTTSSSSSSRAWRYVASLVLCFVALFTKQNTITLGPALVLYDLIVERRRVRVSWAWMRPYVPFALLTIGYLWLRYHLFGEVARENTLNAQNLTFFGSLVVRHLRRLFYGSVTAGSSVHALVALITASIAGCAAVWLAAHRARPEADDATGRRWRSLLYFGPAWLIFGIAPIVVANYESPRHMYLASLGWAIALGVAFEILWHAEPRRVWRTITAIGAGALLAGYTLQLRTAIDGWNTAAAVSRKATIDLEREARALPRGSLLIAGAPASSWEWSLPFAAQPPFARVDVSTHVRIVSPQRLACCRFQWNDDTRHTLRSWLDDPSQPPLVALYWDARTGALSRVTDRDEPFLRSLVPILLDTPTPDALDRTMLDMLARAVAGRSSR